MPRVDMGVTDRLFALRRVPPFDRLRESELILIAEVSRHRKFAGGEVVREAGHLSSRLQVVISGQVETPDASPVAPIIGLASLLFSREAPVTLTAANQGAETLEISRGHLYTILYECPLLTVGFIEQDLFAGGSE